MRKLFKLLYGSQGPVFDSDAKRPQGPVLRWIDRLFKSPEPSHTPGRCGPTRAAVGHAALARLLESNLDIFQICVDRCYDAEPRIANGYFLVLSEAYAMHESVKAEPYVILSLVLYKLVDAGREVREAALHMLQVRGWGDRRGSCSVACFSFTCRG